MLDEILGANPMMLAMPRTSRYRSCIADQWKCSSEAKDVLVLSRKIGERILIGDKIAVTVVKIGHGGVRIGVEAPPELAVVREELARELRRVEQELADEQAEPVVE
jgi:carbon storage regulator